MEWKVTLSDIAVKQLRRSPKEIQDKLRIWKQLVEINGFYLKGGYNTHKLRGERVGEFTAYLNRKWRVIFKVFKDLLMVEVLEITPHQY